MLKVITSVFLLAVLVNAVEFEFSNKLDNDIVVNLVTLFGQENFTLAAGNNTKLDVGLLWSGIISGRYVECTEALCSQVMTEAELGITLDYNVYDISLIDGFNLPISVVPLPEGSCTAVSCTKKEILEECPEENKISVNGTLVACQSSPDLFQTYCSTSFIYPIEDKLIQCPQNTSYRIDFEYV